MYQVSSGSLREHSQRLQNKLRWLGSYPYTIYHIYNNVYIPVHHMYIYGTYHIPYTIWYIQNNYMVHSDSFEHSRISTHTNESNYFWKVVIINGLTRNVIFILIFSFFQFFFCKGELFPLSIYKYNWSTAKKWLKKFKVWITEGVYRLLVIKDIHCILKFCEFFV